MSTANKRASKRFKTTKVNFKKLFQDVSSTDKEFTKKETIRYLRKFILPLLEKNFTMILNPDALVALEENLQGNMAIHVGSISLSDILEEQDRIVTQTSVRFDYTSAEKAIVEYMSESITSEYTYTEIKEHLSEKGMDLTSNRWAFLRTQHMPKSKLGRRYTIKLVKGTSRKSSRWKLARTKSKK